jgi:2-dehydro-3-deoxygluconokinase
MSTAPNGPVVCFGEMLLRLSPPGAVPLAQAGTLEIDVGGAEANVAAALACLGTPSRVVTVLPDNPLGRKARAALGAAGVDTRFASFGEGRIGLYFFERPAGPRAGRVTYDRTGSVFALAEPGDFDFAGALDGARLLHVSGITPALGPRGCELIRAAVATAQAAGVPVCLDGNYRANLWEAWDSDPRAVLTELVGAAQVFIGNHRDISLMLGRSFSGEGADRRREAVEAAFEAFPALQLIASTARHVVEGSHHRLAARADTPGESWQTEEIAVTGIVDRIGTGDAFAAGVLHRYLAGEGPRACAEAGLALAALKHGVPGDMILASERELDEFRPGGNDVRR